MIYFDNAATTFPKPSHVGYAVGQGVLKYGGNPGRSGHSISMNTSTHIFEVRSNIAKFFDAIVENVVFTSNATHALNLAIKGLTYQGGHVMITNMEHNSVSRPVYALDRQGRALMETVPVLGLTQEEMVEQFANRIRPDTRAIICTHASNVTGTVVPIRALAKLCHRHKMLIVVDAAQTAGVLPISMKEDGLDILCTAGHKGLYGPTGTGLMILREGLTLSTFIEGGTGSNSAEMVQPVFSPDRYEAGTVNTVGICGLGAGISYVQKQGIRRIYNHEMQICQYVFMQLSKMPHAILYDKSFEMEEKVPVLSFNIEGMTSMEVVEYLNDKGFALRGGLHCAPLTHYALETLDTGTVRFSPSTFNTMQQAQQFVKTIQQMKNK